MRTIPARSFTCSFDDDVNALPVATLDSVTSGHGASELSGIEGVIMSGICIARGLTSHGNILITGSVLSSVHGDRAIAAISMAR